MVVFLKYRVYYKITRKGTVLNMHGSPFHFIVKKKAPGPPLIPAVGRALSLCV